MQRHQFDHRYLDEELLQEPDGRRLPAPGKVTLTSSLARGATHHGAPLPAQATGPARGVEAEDEDREVKTSFGAMPVPQEDDGMHGGTAFGTDAEDVHERHPLGPGERAMAQLARCPAPDDAGAPRMLGAPIQAKKRGQELDGTTPVEATDSGEPLPERLRTSMEERLGVQLSAVRIHQGSQAASIGALAFTRGTDIFFAPGQYQPDRPEGEELLAHELTHVAQQAQGRVPAPTGDGTHVNDDPALEREADDAGRRATRQPGLARPDDALASTRLQPAGRADIIHRKAVRDTPLETLSDRQLQEMIDDPTQPLQHRERAKEVFETRIRQRGSRDLPNAVKEDKYQYDRDGSKLEESKNTLSSLYQEVSVPDEPAKRQSVPPDTPVTPVTDDKLFKDLPPAVASMYKEQQQGWRGEEDGSHSFPYTDKYGVVQWKNYRTEDGQPLGYSEAKRRFEQDIAGGAIEGTAVTPVRPVGADEAIERQTAAAEERVEEQEQEQEQEQKKKKKLKPRFDYHGLQTDVTLAEGQLLDQRGGTKSAYDDGAGLKLGSATAKVNGNYKVGPNGVTAKVEGEASAKLVDYDRTWSWESEPIEFLGERFSGRVFIFVRGMIGIEAKAAIEANAKLMQDRKATDPELLLQGTGLSSKGAGDATSSGGDAARSPSGESGVSAGVNAEGLAGARLEVGAGVACTWHQKDEKDYADDLRASGDFLVEAISVVSPGLGWLLKRSGSGEAIAGFLGKVLDWKAGQVKLLGAEASVEGTAGIGAKLDAELGFSGGKLTFQSRLGVTFGLGVGVNVRISIDVVEGVKFAIVALGEAGELIDELANLARQWVSDHVDDLIGEAVDLWNDFFDWLSSDDKIREAVANRAHEAATAEIRGQWMATLSETWCSEDDEDAMIEILRYSRSKGDLSQVLSAGLSKREILAELGGPQLDSARGILGE